MSASSEMALPILLSALCMTAIGLLSLLLRRRTSLGAASQPAPAPGSRELSCSGLLHPRTAFGSWGRGIGELMNPRFLLSTAEGILVADSGNNRLQIFSADGEPLSIISGGRPGHPTGLASDGIHVWVADSSNCSVTKVRLSSGSHELRCGSYGSAANEFSAPEGLALAHGVLFVADEGNQRVVLLDAATLTWRGAFGSPGRQFGDLWNPVGLTVIDQELYVRDTHNHRIHVFDVDGAVEGAVEGARGPGACGACLRSFGGAGSAPGLFDTPTGMVHDGHGRLLVSEAGAKRIQVLTTHGVPLQVLALPHAGRLYGMCVRGGVIYVADYENHQVHVLDLKQEQLPLRPPASPARPIVSTQSTVDALYLTS